MPLAVELGRRETTVTPPIPAATRSLDVAYITINPSTPPPAFHSDVPTQSPITPIRPGFIPHTLLVLFLFNTTFPNGQPANQICPRRCPHPAPTLSQ